MDGHIRPSVKIHRADAKRKESLKLWMILDFDGHITRSRLRYQVRYK
jgi:hypothetical protein